MSGAVWSAAMLEHLDRGGRFESFRQIWQTIQHHVRSAIVAS